MTRELRKLYLSFETDETQFRITTPWFSLWIKDGVKDISWPPRCGRTWGFEFWWSRTPDVQEGEFLFQRHFRYESEFIGLDEYYRHHA